MPLVDLLRASTPLNYTRPPSSLAPTDGNITSFDAWKDRNQPPNYSRLAYKHVGNIYNLTYLQARENCFLQATNRYEFGIIGFMFTPMMFFIAFWVFETYGLSVDSLRKGQLSQAGWEMGMYRAVIDLGEALSEDLGTTTCAYSEGKLTKALRKNKGPGLRYYQLSNGPLQHIGLSSWKKEGDMVDLGSASGVLFGSRVGLEMAATGK